MVHPTATGVGPELRADDDRYVPLLREMVRAVKEYDVVFGLQLNHPGRQTKRGRPLAPSPLAVSKGGEVPHALTTEEILDMIEAFGEAARRAREAGFDLVEIHGAHGYLVTEFLSPLSNRRTDGYGGSIQNRARFSLEIIDKIREKAGNDFPIQFRISGSEFVDGGLTIGETRVIARLLEEKGAASISVSAGNWKTLEWIMPPMSMPRGCLTDLAAEIKQAVTLPVITVGRLGDPLLAEEVLERGKADMVALGRGLLADPDWARKVQNGDLEGVRKCLACNTCVERVSNGLDVRCTVNPEAGREASFDLSPAPRARRVMIIGGGPAGMEAARIARLRGHEVTVYEEQKEVGGKLDVASRPPGKAELLSFAHYLARQMDVLGIEVHLGTKVDHALVEAKNPDVAILATGSIPLVPPIPGIDLEHVRTAEEVLKEEVTLGDRVVVIGGSGTGCETAHFLLEKGKKVTIIEMLPQVGMGIEQISRRLLMRRLREGGVRVLTGCKVTRIERKSVTFQSGEGTEQSIEADNVVLALGFRPKDKDFLSGVRWKGERYRIGDCSQPGTIADAVAAAAEVALRI